MKICTYCGLPFEDTEIQETNPFQKMGELFYSSNNQSDSEEICPPCKEKLGILNILGFGD
jgi:hypothetical protein